MARKLRMYQVEAVKELLDKKRILVADEMGLGKTIEGIVGKTAIELQNYKNKYAIGALVTCPLSVVDTWRSEIPRWYQYGEDSKIVHLTLQDFQRQLADARDADFVILDYYTLSRLGTDRSALAKIARIDFEYGIIDEGHNAKNPEALRTMAVQHLFGNMNYLMSLTGTPMPNRVSDIYMLMHLLDAEKFPIDSTDPSKLVSAFFRTFKRNPEVVKNLLGEKMLRRSVKDYLGMHVPELEQDVVEVELIGDHERVYQAILEASFPYRYRGVKLVQLQKAMLDPCLVEPSYLPDSLARRQKFMQSCTYERIDSLLRDISRKNGKALIFSRFREGVTDNIAARWDAYSPVIIDGEDYSREVEGYEAISTGIRKREFLRKRFQTDPKTRLMITTTVMNEGVDLTAATDVVHLGLPYTPSEFDQRNRRSWRFGEVQKDVVRAHIIKTVLSNGAPTLDQGLEEMIENKRRQTTYLLEQPFKLTLEDWEDLKQLSLVRSRHLKPFLDGKE